MFNRVWFAILFLIIVLSACGTAAPTPNTGAAAPSTQGSEAPTTIVTPTPVAASTAAQPSVPPTIVGKITQLDQGMLVEQQPGATIGDKIVFSFNNATLVVARDGDQLEPRTVGDLAVGQRVEVWAAGIILESFPGQAGAATIVIGDAATSSPSAAALPDREPDVVGTITQASNTVIINENLVLFIVPTTQFFRRTGERVESIDARDVGEGQRVEVWTTEIRYGGTPQADAFAIVVIND